MICNILGKSVTVKILFTFTNHVKVDVSHLKVDVSQKSPHLQNLVDFLTYFFLVDFFRN